MTVLLIPSKWLNGMAGMTVLEPAASAVAGPIPHRPAVIEAPKECSLRRHSDVRAMDGHSPARSGTRPRRSRAQLLWHQGSFGTMTNEQYWTVTSRITYEQILDILRDGTDRKVSSHLL